MAAETSEVHFDGAGATIVGEVLGPTHGTAVVLAHGAGQTRHSWAATAGHLVAAGYRVVNVDLRGHGDSSHSPTAAYDLEDFAGDLRTVVDELGRPAVLVGASLGGVASLLAIADAPDPQVVGLALVLVDVAPRVELAGTRRIQDFMAARPDGFADLEEVADAIAAYRPERPRPAVGDGLRKNVRLRGGRWHWHWDPKILRHEPDEALLRAHEARMVDACRRITCPTLVIQGRESDVLSDDGVDHLLHHLPSARATRVARAGHMIAGDANDAFNDAVLRFLDEVTPASHG